MISSLALISFGRHLVGVWIGGVWNGHFPESEKYFSEAEISQKIPEILQKERLFAKSQAPKLENSEPEKMQFHTSSHSIPSLDSLLLMGLQWRTGASPSMISQTRGKRWWQLPLWIRRNKSVSVRVLQRERDGGERERERETCRYRYTYLYIYIYIWLLTRISPPKVPLEPAQPPWKAQKKAQQIWSNFLTFFRDLLVPELFFSLRERLNSKKYCFSGVLESFPVQYRQN